LRPLRPRSVTSETILVMNTSERWLSWSSCLVRSSPNTISHRKQFLCLKKIMFGQTDREPTQLNQSNWNPCKRLRCNHQIMNLISWNPRKWENLGKQKLKRPCDGDESIHDQDLFSHILEPKTRKKLSWNRNQNWWTRNQQKKASNYPYGIVAKTHGNELLMSKSLPIFFDRSSAARAPMHLLHHSSEFCWCPKVSPSRRGVVVVIRSRRPSGRWLAGSREFMSTAPLPLQVQEHAQS
jgi:hypothetical protein